MICRYCGKPCKNANSLRNHERQCKSNPDRVPPPPKTQKFRDAIAKRKNSNQYIKAKELGLPPPTISDDTREKLKENAKNQVWDDERRKKHSRIMKKVVENAPESYSSGNVCGRVRQYEYRGEKFHGKWELAVAKWLDDKGIKWDRKVQPKSYFWKDAWHLYFPDFYLPELDLYIEVKGYETERDRAKWESINKLSVIKEDGIKKIERNKFIIGPIV